MINVSGVISYTLKKLWLSLAVLLVLFAVLVSVLRVALPHIDNHKHYVEEYVANKFGVDFQIGKVSALWKDAGPSIVLSDVVLSEQKHSPVQFRIDKISVDLNVWRSIQERLLISERFDIEDVRLIILPEEFNAQKKSNVSIVKALKNLFLIQLQRFTITNGEVIVKTQQQEEIYELDSLAWLNEGTHHQGKGNIRVRELTNNSASFLVDLVGNDESLSGTFYAKAEALDVSPWLNEWLTTQYPLQESRANITAWLSVADNTLEQIHLDLGGSSLLWANNNDDNQLTEINSGTIQALPVADGWGFRVDKLVISQATKSFVTDVIGHTDHRGNATINTVKPVSLEAVTSVMSLFTGEHFSNTLSQIDLAGELATFQVKWQSQKPSIRAKFLDVSWQSFDNVPGFDAVNLDFVWSDGQGHVSAFARGATLDLSALNGQAFKDVTIDSDVYIYFEQDSLTPSWTISVPKLDITSDTLSLNLQAKHQLVDGFTQIAMHVDALPLNQIPILLPQPIIHEKTMAFLTSALSGSGTVDSADLVWSGNPKAFPYTQNTGVFQVTAKVTDGDFTFSPLWPTLTDLDIDLMFENNSLSMQSSSGYIDTIKLKDMKALIPELKASSGISISARGNGSGKQIRTLLQKSSLTTLSKVLNESVLVEGELDTEIALEIPFTQDKLISAAGRVSMTDAKVSIPAIDIELTESTGTLVFNDSAISVTGFGGVLYEQPIKVNLSGDVKGKDYALDIDASGLWDIKHTFTYFKLPLSDSLTGQFNWQSDITSVFAENGTQFNAEITSDLVGVSSSLPGPLFKNEQDIQALQVDVAGQDEGSQFTLRVGNQIHFNGYLNHRPLTFENTLLSIGGPSSYTPTEKHAIVFSMPSMQLDEWIELQTNITKHYENRNDIPKKDIPLLPTPERLFAQTDNLNYASQTFNHAVINGTQSDNGWRIEFNSKQAVGHLQFPVNWKQDGLTAFAEKLYLYTIADEQSTSNIDQNGDKNSQKNNLDIDFPLHFSCQECRLDDKLIGEVELELMPYTDGVDIKKLSIVHPHAVVNATGKWDTSTVRNTELNGEFKSNDFGKWLDSFELESGIKDSKANIDFDIYWQGSPLDFDLASLSGDLDWDLTDGSLSQVSDKGSRILTIFSLSSLVRKLSLDFRDVFAKGFFYDDIKGTMTVVNGKASTNDTVVDGGVGEIDITGYSQLDTQQLNYKISFTPNVTGNLPFLAYFLVSPPTALAALAIDKVLTSNKVISNINYQITGTFSDPVINEINRDSEEISLPANTVPQPEHTPPVLNKDPKWESTEYIELEETQLDAKELDKKEPDSKAPNNTRLEAPDVKNS